MKRIILKNDRISRKRLKRFIPIYLMMLPGIIYFLINNYIPMFGIIIAFKNVNFQKGILGSDWVGFQNFTYLFKTSDAFIITRNTILYNLAFIIIGTIVQVAFAILLNEIRIKFFQRVYQSIILLPNLLSMVIIAYLVYAFLSVSTGLLNKSVLPFFNIEPVNWYSDPRPWPIILIFVHMWKTAGFGCIIYFSGLISISTEYYEAARIDGASKWQQIKEITIPMLQPIIIMLTILSLGKIFYSDFGLFYQVPNNSGQLYDVTNTIDTYVYNSLIQLGDIGMSSAAAFYQSIVGFILVLLSNFIVRKYDHDSALF